MFYYAGWVEVKYQMMSGRYISMSGHADTSVGVMMRILTQQLGLPDEEHVRLSFNGQAMDHTEVLGRYDIGFLDRFQPPVIVDMTVVKGNPPLPS